MLFSSIYIYIYNQNIKIFLEIADTKFKIMIFSGGEKRGAKI